jgi:DNA-binding MarR family transcriptional regulator
MPSRARADPSGETGDDELAQAIRLVARLASLLNAGCARADLSLVQYRLLLLVARQPPRARTLANLLQISRPTLTSNIDTVVRRGFIRRESVPGDGRGVRLTITPAGRAAVRRAETEQRHALEAVLTPDDLRRLRDLVPIADTFDAALERYNATGETPPL